MLKKLCLLFLLVFSFTGNISAQDLDVNGRQKDSSDFIMKMFYEGVDFYANGNEPFWSMEIAMDQYLKFSEFEGLEINLGSVKSEKAMDANILRYSQQTDKGLFTVTVYQEECFNDMSGEKFDYRVTVELNNEGDASYRKFDGCGNYVPDYRLNRTWILKQTREDVVTGTDYTNGPPEITLDVGKGKYRGNGGCNSFFGSLFYEINILRFGKISSTMMSCPDLNQEIQFIRGLEKVVNYKLKDNQLILSNPDETLLIFTDPTLEPLERLDNDFIDNYRLNDIWVLEKINDSFVQEKNYMKGLPVIELNVKDMTVKGSGGCNQISSTFIADSINIKFGPIAATRMACPGNYESDFLTALGIVDTYRIENNRLYLIEDGQTLLILKKVD